MSTSLLYHEQGVRGYHSIVATFLRAACSAVSASRRTPIPSCHAPTAVSKLRDEFRPGSPAFSLVAHWRQAWSGRLTCPSSGSGAPPCSKTRQAKVAFATTNGVATPMPLNAYALDLSDHMTIRTSPTHLGVGWDTIKEIQKSSAPTPVESRSQKLKHIKHLDPLLDEIDRIGRGAIEIS